jgi:signal transduction histidine kinase
MTKYKDLLPIVVLSLFYYFFGILSLQNAVANSVVTISPFFPEGFSLAFILLFGPRVIPGIFLGQLILAWDINYQLIPSISIALTNSIEALIGYYILVHLYKFDTKLTKLSDVYILFATIIFVLQPFSALSGVSILCHFHLIHHDKYIFSIISWYFGNVLGQALITPIVLYFYHYYKKINYLKLIGVIALFSILTYFTIYEFSVKNMPILFSITLIPLVIILSTDRGLGYALTSIFAISIISIKTFQNNIGIFSIYSDIENLININFFILSQVIITLIIGVLIIEKNKATRRYKQLNKTLKARVRRELEKNREKDKVMFFQSRLAQMGETISMIAHQWRQPLNNLFLINQKLYINYKRDRLSDDDFEKFYENSKAQIELMSKTIDDFKNFFRIDKEKKIFSINQTIEHALSILKPELSNNNIETIIKHHDEKDIVVNGYENEFSQAILNIINNAKDALKTNLKDNRKIFITTRREGSKVNIYIKDNAGGIKTKHIEKIFEPYFSTKEKQGTGLGLYMVKIIIEEHFKGRIKVTNDKDGAVFTITIKVAKQKWGGVIL